MKPDFCKVLLGRLEAFLGFANLTKLSRPESLQPLTILLQRSRWSIALAKDLTSSRAIDLALPDWGLGPDSELNESARKKVGGSRAVMGLHVQGGPFPGLRDSPQPI